MNIAILTDTALDILTNEEKGIFSVPLYVNAKEESHKDLVEISREVVYRRITNETLTTSAPSIEDMGEMIDHIISLGYDTILAIHLSSQLSATIMSSKLALESRDIPSMIFDTRNVSAAGGFFVHYAKELITQGLSLEKIEAELLRVRNNSRIIATVGDLKYLIRGGRLKPIQGMVGSALKIKPILSTIEDGTIEPLTKVRGEKKALEKIIELVKERVRNAKTYYISPMYAEDTSKLSLMEEKLKEEIARATLYEKINISSVLTAQAGPEVYGISVMVID